MTHALAYDLAPARLEAAGREWLVARAHGHDTSHHVEAARREFRREEQRERRRRKRARTR